MNLFLLVLYAQDGRRVTMRTRAGYSARATVRPTRCKTRGSALFAASGGSKIPLASGVQEVTARLAALPSEQRAAVALYYLDGFTVAEIAAALAVPIGTVKTRLFHARRTLRRALTGDHS